jgi:hypothetical protein
MALVFGECGRECLSGPGNTVIILITVQRIYMTGPQLGHPELRICTMHKAHIVVQLHTYERVRYDYVIFQGHIQYFF